MAWTTVQPVISNLLMQRHTSQTHEKRMNEHGIRSSTENDTGPTFDAMLLLNSWRTNMDNKHCLSTKIICTATGTKDGSSFNALYNRCGQQRTGGLRHAAACIRSDRWIRYVTRGQSIDAFMASDKRPRRDVQANDTRAPADSFTRWFARWHSQFFAHSCCRSGFDLITRGAISEDRPASFATN